MKPFIRIALILAGSAIIPAGLSAQTPDGAFIGPPAPAALSAKGLGPRIQFSTENYNAGTNMVGDPIRYTFLVANTGDEKLVLSDVIPSCGCTTIGGTAPPATSGGGTAPGPAATWTHEIAPGQTGIIPIQVVTSNYRGPISKTIRVVSNDRMRPSVTLQVSAFLWLPIEVSPAMATFTLVPDATNLNNQIIKIFNRMTAPLSLSNPQSSTNVFSCVLKTNVPGQEFELTVSATTPAHLPPSLTSTIIQGEISLKSSATNKDPLTIPVYGTITPEITIFPPSIQLPLGPLAQPSISHITIRENVTNITLSNPAMSVPGVDAYVAVLQTNRSYVLSVVFPQDFVARPGQSVTVQTDNPRFPAITVPVTPVPGMVQPMRPAGAIPPARAGLTPPAPRAGSPLPASATNRPPMPPIPAARANFPPTP
jgi:hypothetical protein